LNLAKRANTIPVRLDPELKRFLDDIRLKRVQNGKDKWPKSPARLSLAITRVPNLRKIFEEAKIDD